MDLEADAEQSLAVDGCLGRGHAGHIVATADLEADEAIDRRALVLEEVRLVPESGSEEHEVRVPRLVRRVPGEPTVDGEHVPTNPTEDAVANSAVPACICLLVSFGEAVGRSNCQGATDVGAPVLVPLEQHVQGQLPHDECLVDVEIEVAHHAMDRHSSRKFDRRVGERTSAG